jgi:hypothetical protein
MVGTIGPLVQGALPRLRWRLRIAALFATAFLAGAAVTFFLVFLLGAAAQVQQLPLGLRRGVAAAGLMALASVDVWARSRRTYCPLRWDRQTPRRLMRRRSMFVVASVWGFDTGLAVTTIRVTAATWGALLLTLLGLSGWQTGIAYGLAFAVPVTILMWTHRLGRIADAQKPVDQGLLQLLNKRLVWQTTSAALLVAGGVMLGWEAWVGAAGEPIPSTFLSLLNWRPDSL